MNRDQLALNSSGTGAGNATAPTTAPNRQRAGHRANKDVAARLRVSASHRTVHDVADLSDIVAAQHNVVVLRRDVPEQLKLLQESDLTGLSPQVIVTCHPGESIRASLEAKLLPHIAEPFILDVDYWAQVFADITECTKLGIRIIATERAMCPRFHVDNVVLRGVMTYVGPGTHFLDNRDVDRSALGPPNESSPPIEGSDAVIQIAQAGDLVLPQRRSMARQRRPRGRASLSADAHRRHAPCRNL